MLILNFSHHCKQWAELGGAFLPSCKKVGGANPHLKWPPGQSACGNPDPSAVLTTKMFLRQNCQKTKICRNSRPYTATWIYQLTAKKLKDCEKTTCEKRQNLAFLSRRTANK